MTGLSGVRHVASAATRSSYESDEWSGSVITHRGMNDTCRPWEDEDGDKIPETAEYFDEREDSDEEDRIHLEQRGLGARARGNAGPSGRKWGAGRAPGEAYRGGGGACDERTHRGDRRNLGISFRLLPWGMGAAGSRDMRALIPDVRITRRRAIEEQPSDCIGN